MGFNSSPERGFTTYAQKPAAPPQEEKQKEAPLIQQHRPNNSINKAPTTTTTQTHTPNTTTAINMTTSTPNGNTYTSASVNTNANAYTTIMEQKNPVISTIIQHNLLSKKDSQLPL